MRKIFTPYLLSVLCVMTLSTHPGQACEPELEKLSPIKRMAEPLFPSPWLRLGEEALIDSIPLPEELEPAQIIAAALPWENLSPIKRKLNQRTYDGDKLDELSDSIDLIDFPGLDFSDGIIISRPILPLSQINEDPDRKENTSKKSKKRVRRTIALTDVTNTPPKPRRSKRLEGKERDLEKRFRLFKDESFEYHVE